MDISKLLSSQMMGDGSIERLKQTVSRFDETKIDFADEKRKKVAKDFESIFMHQILSSMKSTIPESDFSDPSAHQIQSMYWSFFSDALSNEGGFGLWKQIYNSMPENTNSQIAINFTSVENQTKIEKLDEIL